MFFYSFLESLIFRALRLHNRQHTSLENGWSQVHFWIQAEISLALLLRHRALILKSAEQKVYGTRIKRKAICSLIQKVSLAEYAELLQDDTLFADFPFLRLQVWNPFSSKYHLFENIIYSRQKKYSSTWDSTCDISLFWVPIFIILCLL